MLPRSMLSRAAPSLYGLPTMDRDTFMALTGLDACVGWLGGLLLLGVGLVAVRKQHATGGLLLGAAGAAKLLLNCCAVWPTALIEAGEPPPGGTVMHLNTAALLLLRFAVYGLAIAGVAMAARELGRRVRGPA